MKGSTFVSTTWICTLPPRSSTARGSCADFETSCATGRCSIQRAMKVYSRAGISWSTEKRAEPSRSSTEATYANVYLRTSRVAGRIGRDEISLSFSSYQHVRSPFQHLHNPVSVLVSCLARRASDSFQFLSGLCAFAPRPVFDTEREPHRTAARPATMAPHALSVALALFALSSSVTAGHVAPAHIAPRATTTITASPHAATITKRATSMTQTTSPYPLTDYTYAYTDIVSLSARRGPRAEADTALRSHVRPPELRRRVSSSADI